MQPEIEKYSIVEYKDELYKVLAYSEEAEVMFGENYYWIEPVQNYIFGKLPILVHESLLKLVYNEYDKED